MRRTETHNLWQVNHGAIVLEDALSDDKPPCQWVTLFLHLLVHGLQYIFQAIEVVVIVPSHSAP